MNISITGEISSIRPKHPPSALDKKPSAVAKQFCLNGDNLDGVKLHILEHILKPPMLKSTTKHRKVKGTSLTGYTS